jgi:hypothetical protein
VSAQEAIRKSARELQLQVQTHCKLVTQVLQGDDAGSEIDASLLVGASHEECPHRRRLRETLADVIVVLEKTRKAFKSKQLEVLRRRLLGVLAEDA